MTDVPDNLVLALLREIRAGQDKMRDTLAEHTARLGRLEQGQARLELGIAETRVSVAELSVRLDRMAIRLDRIETRLGLIEA